MICRCTLTIGRWQIRISSRKKPLFRTSRRWEENISICYTDIVGRLRLHYTGSKEGLMVGFCEYGNEPLGSITTGKQASTSCTHFWCLPLSATYPCSCGDNICRRIQSMKLLITQFSPFTGSRFPSSPCSQAPSAHAIPKFHTRESLQDTIQVLGDGGGGTAYRRNV
jgi:hypothetical protein